MVGKGRPKGHKLSEETKRKIAKTKTGYITPKETRVKISKTLKDYFSVEENRIKSSIAISKSANKRVYNPNKVHKSDVILALIVEGLTPLQISIATGYAINSVRNAKYRYNASKRRELRRNNLTKTE